MAIDVRREVPAPRARGSFLSDPKFRSVLYQVLVVGGVILVGWYLVNNTLSNLARQNIATGFGFLGRESSFAIGEHMISYSAADSYGRAILVGILNTIKVSLLGIVAATVLGTIVGIARLSSNWLVRKLALVYVEALRNVPLLLQLFLWYAVITESLPGPRQALQPVEGVFLSNRGFKIPTPSDHPAWDAALLAFLLALVISWIVQRRSAALQARTGRRLPVGIITAGLVIGLPLLTWGGFGAPLVFDVPRLQGFNFVGGATLTPEFAAMLIGLTTYTAAFIAEIVRSGIQAVSWGQTEAASALGLRPGLTLRLVVLPQALRVIIPPLTSQYLNLTKNSSLAVAIGYADLVSVLNTSINQTGQAIEGVALIMACFLTISLGISIFMNWYNKRIALVER
ncbi:amino acid ABC transporter permease [Arenibaculum pallidiluteum]|uniref:amino acid ABC transporter permease n=1 Tax=Arenibaculum pallidiluteum TaxID=2812559 RepID=UPI001A9780C8|nr:amino acid ABC transporter permease [Arenibaculum pallidiluteum]